jgi:hypothetical protein
MRPQRCKWLLSVALVLVLVGIGGLASFIVDRTLVPWWLSKQADEAVQTHDYPQGEERFTSALRKYPAAHERRPYLLKQRAYVRFM